MSYEFPPEVEHLVKQQMMLGGYVSEDELLREALLALADRREVLDDIRVGIEEMEAERGRTLEAVDDELRKKYDIPRKS